MLKVALQARSIGLTWELVQKADSGTSLVAQWLGIHLTMQGMWF